jgi:cyclopropane fatty-acyl-phospholipid synthase-like methyltransferase
MKTIDESVAMAMECQDVALVPFLPYILQDFWEIGTPPKIVMHFIQKHCRNYSMLHVLDLGCGKGAVSVQLADVLKCHCYGIDVIPEFIETSKEKAWEYGVETLCQFEVGDIRWKIDTLGTFDVIVLGAIGQVFGNYCTTLTRLLKHLTAEGIIIINDGYIDDSSTFQHHGILSHQELLNQIGQTGMELIDEYIGKPTNSAEEFENLQKRCKELMTISPEKTDLFENYIQIQAAEYNILENEIICSIMVIKKCTSL